MTLKTTGTTARIIGLAVLMLLLCSPAPALSVELPAILAGLEDRYGVNDFSAQFFQVSVLKAMDMEDTASGRVWFRKPGMMRWEYDKPERQTIVSNAESLWIHRPEDNQVMVGKAPNYFGNGRGASFLTDIGGIKEQFEITLLPDSDVHRHLLELVPRKRTPDLDRIRMGVNRKTFAIESVVTYNQFGDETRLSFTGIGYDQGLSPSMFTFDIPPEAEVVYLDQ